MRNRKVKKVSIFAKAAGMIVSGVFFSVSTVSMFSPMPQLPDYRIGIILGFILLAGFSLWHFFDLQATIKELEDERKWVEVNLEVMPSVKQESKMTLDENWNITTVCLDVLNKEEISITDCYVTLEKAEHFSSATAKPLPAFSDVALAWKDSSKNGEDCLITIPPFTKQPKSASLWRKERANEIFTFCPTKKTYLRGLYSIVIRVDGKFNGKDIKPVYFEGYLHIDNDKEPIFKEGNWRDNENVVYRMSHY